MLIMFSKKFSKLFSKIVVQHGRVATQVAENFLNGGRGDILAMIGKGFTVSLRILVEAGNLASRRECKKTGVCRRNP